MSADDARARLRVVAERAARLRGIIPSEVFVGVHKPERGFRRETPWTAATWCGLPPYTEDDLMRAAWGSLWDDVNHARAPWASNPWVWRVEFERVEASR